MRTAYETLKTDRQWLHDAAHMLGADDRAKAEFTASGQIAVGGFIVLAQALFDHPAAPWALMANVPRPEQVSEQAWCDALLLANNMTMLLDTTAYALVDGNATLVTRFPSHERSATLLAIRLRALAALAQSAVDGARRSAQPLAKSTETGGSPSGTSQGSPPAPAVLGTSELVAMVRAAAVLLGASERNATSAATAGLIEFGRRQIGLAYALDEVNLVLAMDLAATLLQTPAQRHASLEATAPLMLNVGVALARAGGRPRLMSRWSSLDATPALLAQYLKDFVALGIAIERDAAGAPSLANRIGGN